MEIGIIGLPKSGKTTVFNALTKGKAETDAFSSAALAPNIGVVKVPDPRLDALVAMFKPRKVAPAEVTYIDIALPAGGFGKGEGPGTQFMAYLSKADALAYVVRAFVDDSVPHIEGSIDPARDISTLNLELAFSDLAIIERRLERIKSSLKSAKAQEKEAALKEETLLLKLKAALEADTAIRELELNEQELKTIENFKFLTAKPLLLIVNIGETQLPQAQALEESFKLVKKNTEAAAICGKYEMELTQLQDAEAEEFRSNLNLGESSLGRMIRLSYRLLGLISFFTVGEDEVKAWTIRKGSVATKAAGKIHTDLERGFIRAEVISYDDLMKTGSMAEARKHGVLRLEGKAYTVQDGDIMNILFNV